MLTHMSPYGYANFGVAFGLGLSIVGAAWGIWLTGSSLVGAAVKAPRIRSKNLIRYVRVVMCWWGRGEHMTLRLAFDQDLFKSLHHLIGPITFSTPRLLNTHAVSFSAKQPQFTA